jgi:hypothetical protein
MTGSLFDKRITALENELTALRHQKLALLQAQLRGMQGSLPETPRLNNRRAAAKVAERPKAWTKGRRGTNKRRK